MSENYDIHPDRLTELLAFAGQPRRPVQELEIGTDPGDGSELLDLLLVALRESTAGTRTRVTMHGQPFAMIMPCAPGGGPAVFKTTVYGNSYSELIAAATAEAHGFYGPDAPLVLAHIGAIWTTIGAMAKRDKGEYNAQVTIRCTQLPDEWIVP